jgi:hypothetical protein
MGNLKDNTKQFNYPKQYYQEANLSLMAPEMKKALTDMAFGEGASATNEEVSMMVKSALSRYLSGKPEFGGPTISQMLLHPGAYYAVSNRNKPYRQAATGKFPDATSRNRYAEIGSLVDDILNSGNYSVNDPQFYFTPEEEKSASFDFSRVKPKGTVGRYNTYGY